MEKLLTKIKPKKSKKKELDEKVHNKLIHMIDTATNHNDLKETIELVNKREDIKRQKWNVGGILQAGVGGFIGLVGIVAVIKHEQVGVITSKAFGWIGKSWRT